MTIKSEKAINCKTISIALLSIALVFLSILPSDAATVTWNGGGGDNLASNSANWSGGLAPQNGDNVIFDSTSSKYCAWDLNVMLSSVVKDVSYTGEIIKTSGATLTIIKSTSWTGLGSDNLASTSANWSGNQAPQDGDKIILNNTSSKNMAWDLTGIEPDLFSVSPDYSGTVTLNADLAVTGNLYIAGGTLNLNNYALNVDGYLMINTDGTILAASSTITVKGHWVNGGTFTAGSSKVILAGTNQYIYGDTIFYSLSKIVTSSDFLFFESGKTQTIIYSLTLIGTDSNLLTLTGTSASVWHINPQGARNISYVAVEYLDNVSFANIVAIHSQDLGNNSNVSFGGTECACLWRRLDLARISGCLNGVAYV